MSKIRGPEESKSTLHAAGHKNKIPKQQQQLAENVGEVGERVLSEKKHGDHEAHSLQNRVEDKTHSG